MSFSGEEKKKPGDMSGITSFVMGNVGTEPRKGYVDDLTRSGFISTVGCGQLSDWFGRLGPSDGLVSSSCVL